MSKPEVCDFLAANPEIFFSDEGDAPQYVTVAVHAKLVPAAQFGLIKLMELLHSIQPLPHIKKEECYGILGPDNHQFITAPDIVVVGINYPSDSYRVMTIQFTSSEVTIH